MCVWTSCILVCVFFFFISFSPITLAVVCTGTTHYHISLRRCSPLHPTSPTPPTLTTSHDESRRYHRLADPDKHVDLSQPPHSLIFHRSGHLGLTDTHERKLHSLSVNTPLLSPSPAIHPPTALSCDVTVQVASGGATHKPLAFSFFLFSVMIYPRWDGKVGVGLKWRSFFFLNFLNF